MGIPAGKTCPDTNTSSCPSCIEYMLGAMYYGCQISPQDTYPTCITAVSGNCTNSTPFTCVGYQNSKTDCSGTQTMSECSGSVYGCSP